MSLQVYTAREAAAAIKAPRPDIDGACATGALVAADNTPSGSRRTWRILEDDLIDWHRRGRPLVPTPN